MAIAIFDFDGTIISRDSLPDFLIQACGRKAFLLRLPWIILLKGAALTGILSTHRAKELVISSFLQGMKTEDFHQACLKYASRIPAFVYPAALKEIRRHQEEGNKIAIIKVVREATGLGLADAKKAVEAMGVIKENVPKADADALVAKLKENGATAELK